MSDDMNTTPDASNGADAPDTAQDAGADAPGDWDGNIETLPSKAQEYIRQLREEAAANRVKAKQEAEERQRREQQALAEQGKWKELAEARQRELEQFKGYQERAETLEGLIRKSNQARIERIPEDMRALVPADYLTPDQLNAWLDANEARLVKPTAPNTDAGAGAGGGGSQVRLTEDQKNLARALGISEDKMIEQIKRENQ